MIGGKNGKLTIFIAVLVTVLLLGGWEATEGSNDSLQTADSAAALRSRLASVALEEYETNGNKMGAGEKYWSYWDKSVEQWCVDFVYYCADQLGLVGETRPFGAYTAGCLEAWYQLETQGAQMFAVGKADPQPGDLVFWYSTEDGAATDITNCTELRHVGIVVAYADGSMTTVEGNSGSMGSALNCVAQNTYTDLQGQAWDGAAIWGFARISAGSDNLIEMVKAFEGFSKYPYWDYAQYSVGYGTRCPDNKLQEYQTYGISDEDALLLLEQEISLAENEVDAYLRQNKLEFSTHQRDALTSLTYNIGAGWMSSAEYSNLRAVIAEQTDDLELVKAFTAICHAGGEILPSLVERRICEAHLFLTGEYITNYKSSGYGYVIFDGVLFVQKEAAS